MPHDTRIALFLIGELVTALRANDPDAFGQWLSGGVQDLGEPVVEELLLDWLYSFLTVELVPVLAANAPDLFNRWLSWGGSWFQTQDTDIRGRA